MVLVAVPQETVQLEVRAVKVITAEGMLRTPVEAQAAAVQLPMAVTAVARFLAETEVPVHLIQSLALLSLTLEGSPEEHIPVEVEAGVVLAGEAMAEVQVPAALMLLPIRVVAEEVVAVRQIRLVETEVQV